LSKSVALHEEAQVNVYGNADTRANFFSTVTREKVGSMHRFWRRRARCGDRCDIAMGLIREADLAGGLFG
jgi:hypothetical protein